MILRDGMRCFLLLPGLAWQQKLPALISRWLQNSIFFSLAWLYKTQRLIIHRKKAPRAVWREIVVELKRALCDIVNGTAMSPLRIQFSYEFGLKRRLRSERLFYAGAGIFENASGDVS